MSFACLTPPEKNCNRIHQRKLKQISRIIKHLRNQLQLENPTLHLPSDTTIDTLVNNAIGHRDITDKDWHLTIYQTLQYIVSEQRLYQYTKPRRQTLLAINGQQIKAFAVRLLCLLNARQLLF